MIAVDDWNALYWRTGYHEWLNNKHRKRVDAGDVRLVAALRGLMEGPPPPPSDSGVAPCLRLLAATSRGSSISESLRVLRPQGSLRTVSTLSTRQDCSSCCRFSAWRTAPVPEGASAPRHFSNMHILSFSNQIGSV